VQNLADRKAWAGVTSWGAVSPMIPRTLVVSASVDF
jgi:iron complex outermembrane receptor protein